MFRKRKWVLSVLHFYCRLSNFSLVNAKGKISRLDPTLSRLFLLASPTWLHIYFSPSWKGDGKEIEHPSHCLSMEFRFVSMATMGIDTSLITSEDFFLLLSFFLFDIVICNSARFSLCMKQIHGKLFLWLLSFSIFWHFVDAWYTKICLARNFHSSILMSSQFSFWTLLIFLTKRKGESLGRRYV